MKGVGGRQIKDKSSQLQYLTNHLTSCLMIIWQLRPELDKSINTR